MKGSFCNNPDCKYCMIEVDETAFRLSVRLLIIIIIMGFVSFYVSLEAYAENDSIETLCLLAEQGDANAQLTLGLMYEKGERVPLDYKEAFKWYRKSAGQGHPTSQFLTGMFYLLGQGVPQHYIVGYAWWCDSHIVSALP